ncbi:MAG: hypothetical protein HZB38_06045, partial [Planctomycetes bacterium]|nr:hypothetical protein [Planctomycetota bacterium]
MTSCRFPLLLLASTVVLCGCPLFQSSDNTVVESEEMRAAMEKQRQREAEQAKNATYAEANSIHPENKKHFKSLSALVLAANGDLLAADAGVNAIYTFNAKGEQKDRWRLDFAPQAMALAPDGTVCAAGSKVLAKLDAKGKVVKQVSLSGQNTSAATASDRDVFVCVRTGTGFTVTRMNHELEESKEIVEGLRGCCGILDIVWRENKLYAAENGRFRIVSYDRDGKEIAKWGEQNREDVAKFGGCCNPKNLCIIADGRIITAESSPDRVKLYNADGKYETLLGWFTGRD